MSLKVELHQLVDLSIDVHGGKSTVNFGLLNKLLHELIKNMGIGSMQVVIEGSDEAPPPPKEALAIPAGESEVNVPSEVNGVDIVIDRVATGDNLAPEEDTSLAKQAVSFATVTPSMHTVTPSMHSIYGGGSDKLLVDLQSKVSGIEKKLSVMDNLVPDDVKVEHTESYVGDMWNFVNLGKRVDGCESGLEVHSKLLDELRKGIKQFNDYKFYLDQLKNNSAMDLRQMIDGLIADMGEKTKEIKSSKDRIKALESAKPDESLAKELSEKVAELMKMKGEIDSKLLSLPSMEDIKSIEENFVTWIGLDEILRNYKPPRTPVPPSREGIEALQKAGELGQKTDDLGNKIEGLEKEVQSKIDTDVFEAKMEEAIKQKRPLSSRTEMARKRFTEAMQELADRIAMLEAEFGGKSMPDDLKTQLDALHAGMADALKAVNLIGEISQENETNKSAIAELNGQIEDLLDRYKILQDSIDSAPKGTSDIDSATVQALKDTINALQEEQEVHHSQLTKMSDENMQKDLHLKTLYSGVDDLREMKADKDFVVMEMEEKADKRSVDHKANRVFVDDHFDKLNSGLENALKRCQGQEEALKNAMAQITNDVDGKLDRMELENVKDFLENRLNKLKGTAPPPPPPREEDADPAGMRRRLLKFHCISCDRPVEVNAGGMIPSALPVAYGFPGMRSNRPYTTYELELIRQHQRNQNVRYPWSDPYDMPPTSRSCGGQHTMTYAHRRTRISALSQFFKEEEVVAAPVPLRETEIQGQDGHIYRGRLQQKFPVLPRVGQSGDKLNRIMSPRRRALF